MGSEISNIFARDRVPLATGGRGFQTAQLAINVPVPNSQPEQLSAGESAARRADQTVSNAALSLTERETLTENQLTNITSLLSLATAYKNETSADRKTDLTTEAQSLVTQTNTAYSDASSRDPNIAEDATFFTPVNQTTKEGTAGHNFSTTLPKVPSLADVGVSATVSFADSTIDDTITQLEGAQTTLRNTLSAYSSSRTAITQTVQEQKSLAAQSDQKLTTIADAQQLAASFQARLRSATDVTVAHRVQDLNAPELLADKLIEQQTNTERTRIRSTT